jgi:hypothetical protein
VSGLRYGLVVDGRDLDMETPPDDPYHQTSGTRDGWYIQEVWPNELGGLGGLDQRFMPDTEAAGTYVRPYDLSSMAWFPLPPYSLIAFVSRFYMDAEWRHYLVWPDLTNQWMAHQVTLEEGGSAGDLTTTCSKVYSIKDNGFAGVNLATAQSPLNNRTQAGKRLVAASDSWAMVAWTAAGPVLFSPQELRSWRADCP